MNKKTTIIFVISILISLVVGGVIGYTLCLNHYRNFPPMMNGQRRIMSGMMMNEQGMRMRPNFPTNTVPQTPTELTGLEAEPTNIQTSQ